MRRSVNLKVLHWIARIWSIGSNGFLLFMFFGHIFGSKPFGTFAAGEMLLFFFFPICVFIGLSLAWVRVGLGGMIATVGIIAFHLVGGDLNFITWIDGLSTPGVLFLVYWLLSRKAK